MASNNQLDDVIELLEGDTGYAKEMMRITVSNCRKLNLEYLICRAAPKKENARD